MHLRPLCPPNTWDSVYTSWNANGMNCYPWKWGLHSHNIKNERYSAKGKQAFSFLSSSSVTCPAIFQLSRSVPHYDCTITGVIWDTDCCYIGFCQYFFSFSSSWLVQYFISSNPQQKPIFALFIETNPRQLWESLIFCCWFGFHVFSRTKVSRYSSNSIKPWQIVFW